MDQRYRRSCRYPWNLPLHAIVSGESRRTRTYNQLNKGPRKSPSYQFTRSQNRPNKVQRL
jgi:hypothetical protein